MPSERILVVDDEKGVVRSCVRILQRQGYTASGITNSHEALNLLEQAGFDLLLTDIKMPCLDGLELLRLAKEIDPHLTVVLITGYSTMEDAITAIRLGAQGFLMKPFEPAELVSTVKENLARRALLRDSLRLQTLLPLLEINQILQVSGSEASLIRRVLEIARRETGAARLAWLKLTGPTRTTLNPHQPVYHPIEMVVVNEDQTGPSSLPLAAIEAVLAQTQPHWVLADGAVIDAITDQLNIVGALLPLVIKGQMVGLLTAETGQSGRIGPFNPISLDLLSVLAGQLAMMLENVQLFQQTEALHSFNNNIIQNMTNGLIAVDHAGCLTAFNPAAARMLSYPAAQVLGQPVTTAFAGYPNLVEVLTHTLSTGQPYPHCELNLLRPDGVELPISVSAAPLSYSQAMLEPPGVVTVLEDLSGTKALEAERRRLDRLAALGQMSAVVAHEIRNPVAGIAAGVDYLTRNIAPDSPEFEGVTLVRGEIQRVNRILEDILFVARPARLNLSSEDVAQIIEHVLQRCQRQVIASQVTVITRFDPHVPPVPVDRQRLEQVFTNLIINATQAMPQGGQLFLQTYLDKTPNDRETGQVIITIADTGPGIPVEMRHKIFEPFFTTKTKGTGLGLTVAHRIIEEHGGMIGFDNQANQGTCFTICLPVTRRPAP